MIAREIDELRYGDCVERLLCDISSLAAGSLLELRGGLRDLGAARSGNQQRALAAVNRELADRGVRP